jgi:hypothetical protein
MKLALRAKFQLSESHKILVLLTYKLKFIEEMEGSCQLHFDPLV